MIVTHELKMDLGRREDTPVIHVVQDDRYSRDLSISLYSQGRPWSPDPEVSVLVGYEKPDGTGGSYNTLPDGAAAWRIAGHRLTIALAPQVCTASGRVDLSVVLVKDDARISSFPISLQVHPTPGLRAVSQDYYHVTGTLPNSGWTPDKLLATDSGGHVVTVDPPRDAIQTVNGIGPDDTGNITLPCSALPRPAAASAEQFLRIKTVDPLKGSMEVEAVYLNAQISSTCMYNELELPVLPEEIAVFPYRCINGYDAQGVVATYYAYGMSEAPTTWIDDSFSTTCYYGFQDRQVRGRRMYWNSNVSDWTPMPGEENPEVISVEIPLRGFWYQAPGLIWSSTDVPDQNGEIYMAGSEPQPVYNTAADTGSQNPGPSFPHIVLDSTVHPQEEVTLSGENAAKIDEAVQQDLPLLITFSLLLEGASQAATISLILNHLSFEVLHIFTTEFRLLFLDNQMYVVLLMPSNGSWVLQIGSGDVFS